MSIEELPQRDTKERVERLDFDSGLQLSATAAAPSIIGETNDNIMGGTPDLNRKYTMYELPSHPLLL